MKEKINILIGSDINYAPYYGVMLTSLLINNKDSVFDIYLITDESWSNSETARFKSLCNDFNSEFHVYCVNASDFKDYPQTGQIALSTYYRLEAARILPQEIHKILYLDGDMIVVGDIKSLWNTDIKDKGIACVLDSEFYKDDIYSRLNIQGHHKTYCNAGVSLYNMDYWRENNVTSKAIEYIKSNIKSLYWMDQDVINVLLKDDKVILPTRYNFQTAIFMKRNWTEYDDLHKNYLMSENNEVVIIHYSSQPKPWNFRYFGAPYYKVWDYYRSRSLWKNCLLRKPINKYIKYLVKRYLMPMFFKKQISEVWHIDYTNQKKIFFT